MVYNLLIVTENFFRKASVWSDKGFHMAKVRCFHKAFNQTTNPFVEKMFQIKSKVILNVDLYQISMGIDQVSQIRLRLEFIRLIQVKFPENTRRLLYVVDVYKVYKTSQKRLVFTALSVIQIHKIVLRISY